MKALKHVGLVLAAASLVACSPAPRPTSGQQDASRTVDGRLQVVDGSTWIVESQLVVIPPETPVDGRPTVGARAHVVGSVGPAGEIVAREVQLLEAPVQQVRPTATRAPTARPTPPPDPPTREKHKQRGRGRGGDDDEDDD